MKAVSTILAQDLSLSKDQMEFERGDFRQLIVEIVENDQPRVLISRQGPGFFTNVTPVEISDVLKPFF